jgi:hypothetical protein
MSYINGLYFYFGNQYHSLNLLHTELTDYVPVGKIKTDFYERLNSGSVFKQQLTPGYLDDNKVFWVLPLRTKYVQLNSITIEKISHEELGEEVFKTDLILYDKAGNKEPFELSLINKPNKKKREIPEIIQIINFINEYIEFYGEYSSINFEKFKKTLPYELGHECLLGLIKMLRFEFWSDSRNVPGKDNKFWNEAIITNLPNDNYLQPLFIQSLGKLKDISKSNELFDKYKVTYDYESAWAPSHTRSQFEDPAYQTDALLKLSFDLGKCYNAKSHLFNYYNKNLVSDDALFIQRY